MIESIVLGEVDVPSGILLVLDPGLGRFWRHDGDPRSPNLADAECVDLGIMGPDAESAERAYYREFLPGSLFDVPVDDVDRTREYVAAFVAERGFDARAEVLARRIPHTERAKLAVDAGGGAGVVTYNDLWAVAVAGLPVDRPLPVVATPMPDGEFAGRWRSIDVVVDPQAEVARTQTVKGVMVDHGQLMCVDLDAMGEFRMGESHDGLADFVFWGADAADLATKVGARSLTENEFGWADAPIAAIGAHAERTQQLIAEEDLQVAVDYRPHDNLERLNTQVRTNKTRAGTLTLGGARACGFDNRWGDLLFTLASDLDAAGGLVRVRLDVGNDDSQCLMRRMRLLACGAVVSGLVFSGEHPPRFIERTDPYQADDSGWLLFSGAESEEYMDDPANFRIIAIRALVDRFPAFAHVLDAPPGSLFRLQEGAFVPD
jgi:hypothetical protein